MRNVYGVFQRFVLIRLFFLVVAGTVSERDFIFFPWRQGFVRQSSTQSQLSSFSFTPAEYLSGAIQSYSVLKTEGDADYRVFLFAAEVDWRRVFFSITRK